jgi:micrococcal nuclease
VPPWIVPATIRRVVDGDTLRCDLDLGWGVWLIDEPIRLARIDAPEVSTLQGQAAAAFLRSFIGQRVGEERGALFTSKGFDKYRRALGELTHPTLGNLSDAMLASQHAAPYTGG